MEIKKITVNQLDIAAVQNLSPVNNSNNGRESNAVLQILVLKVLCRDYNLS